MRAVLSRPTFPQMPHMSDFLRGLWGRRRFLSNRICSWSLSVSAGPAFEANRPTQDLEPLGEGSPHGFSSRFADGERKFGSKNDEAGNRHGGGGALVTESIGTPMSSAHEGQFGFPHHDGSEVVGSAARAAATVMYHSCIPNEVVSPTSSSDLVT